jgi:hypothetical protein
MATAEQIIDVRGKTNEKGNAPWTDEDISGLIDSLGGTDLVAAHIWRKKAASYADLVNTSEAGASRSFSDLYQRAVELATHYETQGGAGPGGITVPRAKVHVINRIH